MKQVRQLVQYACRDTLAGDVTGKGIGIALLDTGVNLHPDLSGSVAGFIDLVQGKENPYDDNGHGTHVAGILCGTGKASGGEIAGIAQGSHLFVIKVLDQKGSGEIPCTIQGLRLAKKYCREYGIRIVNISMGALEGKNPLLEKHLLYMAEQLWDLGMVVIAAAGNYGPQKGTVTLPGISKKIITVGSLGAAKKDCSGCGPTRECICKPDLVAPGCQVLSCNGFWKEKNAQYYVRKSGTSMATPVVSGGVALYLSKYFARTNKEVKLALRRSCKPVSMPKARSGWGLLNIKCLLEEK